MLFKEKLFKLKLDTGPRSRIVATIDRPYGAVLLVVKTDNETVWFYVWDDPTSKTDVRWLTAIPPNTLNQLNKLERLIEQSMANDLKLLVAGTLVPEKTKLDFVRNSP